MTTHPSCPIHIPPLITLHLPNLPLSYPRPTPPLPPLKRLPELPSPLALSRPTSINIIPLSQPSNQVHQLLVILEVIQLSSRGGDELDMLVAQRWLCRITVCAIAAGPLRGKVRVGQSGREGLVDLLSFVRP